MRGLISVLMLLCWTCSGAMEARAGTPNAEGVPLGGLWKGSLPLLGGELEVTVSIVPLANGRYFAALDVPAQKVSRLPTEITVRGDSVLMRMPAAGSHYAALLDTVRRELQGVWTQAGVQAKVLLRYSPMPSAAGASIRLAPPYREEEIVFNNPVSRLNLSGMLTVPAGPGPFPAVVLVSDLGAQDRDGTVGDYRLLGSLADYLTRRGIAVLRYDDRGVGLSEGSIAATTTQALVSDVQSAINFLRARMEIDISRIGAIGHGEGANVALLAAGQPLPPAFVVSLAGYGLTGQQTLLEQQVAQHKASKLSPVLVQAAYERKRTMYDIIRLTSPAQALSIVSNMLRQDQPGLDAPAAQAAARPLLTPWHRYFLSFDPLEQLDQVRCPVLLLSGTSDLEAPADLHQSQLEKELRSFKHSTTAKRLPGVNHLFQPPKTEWTLVDGEMKPIFSSAAQEVMREWIVGLMVKK